MSLYTIAFLIFLAIAAGGAFMATFIARGKPIPTIIPPVHGIGALAGLAVLAFAVLGGAASERAWWALGIFTAGALGGLVLFKIVFKQRAPLWLALGHGSLGAVGLIVLYPLAF